MSAGPQIQGWGIGEVWVARDPGLRSALWFRLNTADNEVRP